MLAEIETTKIFILLLLDSVTRSYMFLKYVKKNIKKIYIFY